MKRASQAGIDPESLTAWITDHLPAVEPPLTFTLMAGGRSNLTYRVQDLAGHAFALRRPPVSHVLPTAHDMAREYRIISALDHTTVPVPRPLGLCEDPSVNGSPFYVMEFIDGLILYEATATAVALDPAARPAIGEHLSNTLAAIHAVDVDSVGLGDLARHDAYIERQIRRWTAQFAQSADAGVERPGAVEAVGEQLASRIPPQRGSTIVHGDYRLDNALIGHDGQVVAILDWELCTLGEPLADVGTFIDYWSVPTDGEPLLGPQPATVLPGFWSTDQVLDQYAKVSGRDMSDIGYFMAFGYWRLACILQGVYARYLGGAKGGDPESVEHFPHTVSRLANLAARALA